MFKKNKLINKKENHNDITINTQPNDSNIFVMILKELQCINKSLSKQQFQIKEHNKRIKKLEDKVGV